MMMSIQETSVDASSQSNDIELAHRIPLPGSTSTFFLSSDTQSHLDSTDNPALFNNSRNILRNVNESALPPVDKGLGAWSFLAAAFMIEAIVWVFRLPTGSFSMDPRWVSQKNATSLLPLIGTLSSGIIYCSGPFLNPIATRYLQHRRKAMWVGAVLSCGTLFGASYATEIYQLILLQGILYAVGGSLLYQPCISFMPEWFVARRGMANGILFAGTSAGGLLLPLALPPLMSKYGPFKTLRILAIGAAIVLLPLLPFLKGRLPQTRVRIQGPAPRGAPGHRDWMKDKLFWIFMAVNTLQGFTYFVPLIYLPTFATDLHISSSNSAVTLAMLNGASVVGRISMGYLSDWGNPWILALITLFTTSVTTFVLWGVFSHSFAGLLAFGIAYGSIAGGWSSLWTGFVRPLANDDPAMSTTLYGYLLLTRGLGNIMSAPISAKLYSQPHNITSGPGSTGFDVGYGRFEKMIIYVGTCFAGAAGVAVLGLAMDARKGRQTPGNRVSE